MTSVTCVVPGVDAMALFADLHSEGSQQTRDLHLDKTKQFK